LDNLLGSLRNFGWREGLILYLKLKNFQRDHITISSLPHKVHLRPGSTDNCVFKQIFLKQDLNISALKNYQPTTILDLGANIGMSSLFLTNKFPDATILGVEPDAANAEMFIKNLKNYTQVELKLGAIRGDNKPVAQVDTGRGQSGYQMISDDAGLAAITIGDILKTYGWKTIDILKMDIEGSEKSVFEGDTDSWLPYVKIMFVELHDRKVPGCSTTLFNALKKYNFSHVKSGEYEVLINLDLF
jgi:FkbM family methyltransferase